MFHKILFLQVLVAVSYVQAQEAFDVVETATSRLSVGEEAQYSCKFTNQWSGTRHPIMYPSDAHWSSPVLASHNSVYEMWSDGALASNGVERVAEVGSTSLIINEIETAARTMNSTGDFVRGFTTFNSNVQEQVFDDLNMTMEYSLLSTITMIADSPDWFSGFYNFDVKSESGTTWYKSFTIDTYPWDAGTEQGDTYQLGNPAQVPALPISRFTVDTVNENGIFLSPDNTTVLPVASWTCTLLNEPECAPRGEQCETNFDCCSGRCGLGICAASRPATGKLTAKLSDGRGGAGGASRGGGRKLRGL